ncbi:MAG: TetR/AcrR family transcriptional regulator [Duganella sp.]
MSNTDRLPAEPRAKGRPRGFDRAQALVQALDVFWRRGYEPASVAELCAAMGINPPSLYAAFGSKSRLFLEAVDFYERTYWDATWARLGQEPDVHRAVDQFFKEAAAILLAPQVPCGCLVVLAAINVSADSTEVFDTVKALRQEGIGHFSKRLKQGVKDGQLAKDTDVKSLAAVLNTLLEGMSIHVRDGVTVADMKKLAAHAVRLLPPH